MKMSKHYWIVAYTQTGYNNDDHNVLNRSDFNHSLLVISSHKYNKSNLITSTMNIYDFLKVQKDNLISLNILTWKELLANMNYNSTTMIKYSCLTNQGNVWAHILFQVDR